MGGNQSNVKRLGGGPLKISHEFHSRPNFRQIELTFNNRNLRVSDENFCLSDEILWFISKIVLRLLILPDTIDLTNIDYIKEYIIKSILVQLSLTKAKRLAFFVRKILKSDLNLVEFHMQYSCSCYQINNKKVPYKWVKTVFRE